MDPIRLSVGSRDAILDALTGRIDAGGAGSIRLYAGPMPADPDLAPTAQLLATVALSPAAFMPSVDGLAEAGPIEPGTAMRAGVIRWARIVNGGGEVVFDCSVGTDNAVVVMNTTETFVGAPVVLRAFKLRAEAG